MSKHKHKPPPATKEALRPVDKAFIHSIMFEMGVLPIEDPRLDMNVPLRQLSAEEARLLKRKFRKLWRKYMRENMGDPNAKNAQARDNFVKIRLGVGKQVPSRAERLERKKLVYTKVWNDLIAPLLVKFENPEREQTKTNE